MLKVFTSPLSIAFQCGFLFLKNDTLISLIYHICIFICCFVLLSVLEAKIATSLIGFPPYSNLASVCDATKQHNGVIASLVVESAFISSLLLLLTSI